jgi:ATP-dependent Lon protease
MEVIRLSGYITEEKVAIAKRHLWPKQLEKAGVEKQPEHQRQRAALDDRRLRPRSRVRQLEKQLGKLVRKAVVKLLEPDAVIKIGPKDLEAPGHPGVPQRASAVRAPA